MYFGLNCFAQNFHLKITGNLASDNKIIDSLGYDANHTNAKSIYAELNLMSDKLSKTGYIENKMLENSKSNDSSFVAKFSLGKRIKYIHLYVGTKKQSFPDSHQDKDQETKTTEIYTTAILKELIGLEKMKDSLVLPYSEIEPLLNQTIQKLEQKGFSLAKLKLINIQRKKNTLYADMHFEFGTKRQLNAIVVKFESKNNFPKGHLNQVNRKFHNSIFNQDVVHKIHDEFEKFQFVSQIKYPEILFTKDSTNVYVYLENRKSNTFDGFIGFANDKNNKLVFNGYLDLALENILGSGEQLFLYWKSDGNNQKSFNTGIQLPYLLNSPLGLKAQIQIFKQDIQFQNTKTAIDLGYFINYDTRIYLGYQSTESSDIQNTNSSTLSDYKNSYLTTNFEYSKYDTNNSLFSKKTNLIFIAGIGTRATNDIPETVGKSNQFYISLNAMHNFYLNKKNCINLNYQNYFLKSDTYIINELFRFGGSKSIRGFAENSLQASFMSAIITEYRYIVSPNLYLHSIVDYGNFQDNSSSNKGNLLGFGLGLGLQTKNGLLKISIASGRTKNKELNFNDAIVNISYNVKF